MAKKEKSQVVEPEVPFMQKPTITDAVTYIVDEQGNEIKEGAAVKEKKED